MLAAWSEYQFVERVVSLILARIIRPSELRKMKMKVTTVRISKLETGGWLAQVIVKGEVVRSYECRTFKEAQEIGWR